MFILRYVLSLALLLTASVANAQTAQPWHIVSGSLLVFDDAKRMGVNVYIDTSLVSPQCPVLDDATLKQFAVDALEAKSFRYDSNTNDNAIQLTFESIPDNNPKSTDCFYTYEAELRAQIAGSISRLHRFVPPHLKGVIIFRHELNRQLRDKHPKAFEVVTPMFIRQTIDTLNTRANGAVELLHTTYKADYDEYMEQMRIYISDIVVKPAIDAAERKQQGQ